MLLSQRRLRVILGGLWLVDGVLQLFPQMWTANMINGIMVPIEQGQPGAIASSLHVIITTTSAHLVLVNLVISVVQVMLGLLLISGRLVKEAILGSIVWALIVWYGGEGMSMLLTGTGSILTGAPGAVLLYPVLGLAVYPRAGAVSRGGWGAATPSAASQTAASQNRTAVDSGDEGIVSRQVLRRVLAGFWLLAAVLQLQPYWWTTTVGEPGPISQAIGNLVGQGGLNGVLVDPLLSRLALLTAQSEVVLNSVLLVVFLALGMGLLGARQRQLRPLLLACIVVSLLIWYSTQAFGMILTGMATDFNSGLLLVVLALAAMPTKAAVPPPEGQLPHAQTPMEHSAQSG